MGGGSRQAQRRRDKASAGQPAPPREVVAPRPEDGAAGEGLGPPPGQGCAGEAGVGRRRGRSGEGARSLRRHRGRRPRPRVVAGGRHVGGAHPPLPGVLARDVRTRVSSLPGDLGRARARVCAHMRESLAADGRFPPFDGHGTLSAPAPTLPGGLRPRGAPPPAAQPHMRVLGRRRRGAARPPRAPLRLK